VKGSAKGGHRGVVPDSDYSRTVQLSSWARTTGNDESLGNYGRRENKKQLIEDGANKRKV